MFYALIHITRSDDHYWPVGLFVHAERFSDAVKLFESFCLGVELGLGKRPYIEEVTSGKTRDRQYHSLTDSVALREELKGFLEEKIR